MARNDGREFERSFAQAMQRQLKVDKTEVNQKVRGEQAVDAFECDIHGMVYSPFADVMKHAGLLLFLGGLGMTAAALFMPELEDLRPAQQTIENAAASLSPHLAGYGLMTTYVLAVVAGLAALWAAFRTHQHIWVECKDRKTPVNRSDIFKLRCTIEKVRAEATNTWAPHDVWFASTVRFTQDALTFAKESRIRCFLVSGTQIQEL